MNRFRLMDLLVAIGCAAMILGVAVVARQNAQSAQDVAGCASHLKQIHTAISAYRVDTNAFPRTRYAPDAPIIAYTGATAPSPFSQDGPAVNDVTAAAFLLVHRYQLAPDTFNCPAALRNGLAERDDFDPRLPGNRSNFRARVNYNYSIANMYPSAAAVASGYDLNKVDADFALASDTSPGREAASAATTRMTVKEVRLANSPNHQRDGQNILFADGSVRFSASPFVRDGADNIFASSATFPAPADAGDAVLLPVWSDGPDVTPYAVQLRRWVFIAAMILTTLMLVWIVVRGTRRAKQERGQA